MAEAKNTTNLNVPSMGRNHPGGGGPGRFAPGQKPKNTKKTLRRIIEIYMRWGKAVLWSFLLIVCSALITVAIPYFVGQTFNTFVASTKTVLFANLIWLLAIIGMLYVANWLISTINGIVMLKVSQRLVFVLRSEFFSKLQRLPLSFFDSRPNGDTMSRLTNDVDNISSTIAQTTAQLLSSVLNIGGALIIMLFLNFPLTLTVLVSVPLMMFLTKTVTSRSKNYFLAQQRSLGMLNGRIEESIVGLKMIKAFGRKEAILEEFSVVNTQLYESSVHAQIWAGFMMPLMNVINNFTFTLVAIVGGVLSAGYGLSIGVVVSFLNYAKQFGQPLNAIAGMFNTIQSALAGAERVFEILDEQEEPKDAPNAIELRDPKGEVVFEQVCFSYTPERQILDQVSFHVKPGETIALVGETGAGKTTIVNLLTRFYDATSGNILIDGIPILQIQRRSLRNCFSVVLQDTCLFTGTIRDNIRYSKPTATDAEVLEAAQLAHAHSFIERLPKGYDTMVSGSADHLSQGQRQLLAIARAVLSDAPILILDEATSSVDTKTEKEIQQALLQLMKNHTSFLIAHRLSTIRDADWIMVIGEGRILEKGNHTALMAQKGIYYAMVMSQLGQFEI